METKRLSLKLKSTEKVRVRKDLFGSNNSQSGNNGEIAEINLQSPLDSIWGASDSYTFTQPTSKSVLLSPALKRSPNRFSTSPSPKKSPQTPKKQGSPRKLSKYSPFRKKVYNANPKDSIKNFFQVKDRNPVPVECSTNSQALLGINVIKTEVGLISSSPGNVDSTITFKPSVNTEMNTNNSEGYSENTPSTSTSTPTKTFTSSIESTNTSTPISKSERNGSNVSTPRSVSKNLSPSSKLSSTKDVYGSFLLRVLLEIMMNETDETSVKLFSEEEYAYIQSFNKFDQPSQRLYGRLLNRKIDWIRTTAMKYGDINLELLLLEQNGFITSDKLSQNNQVRTSREKRHEKAEERKGQKGCIKEWKSKVDTYEDCSGESLDTLLNILNIPELKKLCKSYKITESGVKHDLISRLISRSKQPSIKNYFTKDSTNSSSGERNLRSKIYESLGTVIKVASGPQKTFARCLLFFSFPHYHGLERDRFSDQLALVGQLRNLTFPSYEVNRTNIFSSRERFLAYETALIESSDLHEAKAVNDMDKALDILRGLVLKLTLYLENQEIRTEVEAVPDFLRRFTAGYCYVRAISSSVNLFKKWEHTLGEAEQCLELLLNQRLFRRHWRGEWFDQLSLLYQRYFKDNVKATQTVLRGLRDEYVDVVSRHTLCARATMLEGVKKNGIKDHLKDALAAQRGLVEPLVEPQSITISEQIVNGSRPGLKQVYVQDSKDGKMLSSVEEVVREHYRKLGYTHGGHDEGKIIKSLVFACFWDEIYGEPFSADCHGLFHSEFQTVPLDWNSETFYDRRREKLKSKLQDWAEGGVEAVISTFKDSFSNNLNKESIVNWKYLDNYEITESLIRSIEVDFFLNISRLLLRHHRIYGAGFPDLTLWDPREKKCVFVEVKSPNDQLSMKQRVWLHTLTKMGASAFVCHVQSVGCKNLKRKFSSSRENCSEELTAVI